MGKPNCLQWSSPCFSLVVAVRIFDLQTSSKRAYSIHALEDHSSINRTTFFLDNLKLETNDQTR